MKQRKNYPKTAKAIAGFAVFLVVLGFKAAPFFLLAAFFGLIALILALGPDSNTNFSASFIEDNHSSPNLDGMLIKHNDQWLSQFEAGF
ncbi:MAG: hypothetical protein COB08_008875 [Rhodobacteraceae bacterium]|nr:hypothetical protein [Paracoccaceae bacterium]